MLFAPVEFAPCYGREIGHRLLYCERPEEFLYGSLYSFYSFSLLAHLIETS